MLYAIMFAAGALWTATVFVILAACVAAGRFDREIERERAPRKVSYLRLVV